MGKPEGTVESHLKDKAEAEGFLYYKFTSPGRRGVPDRVLLGNGHVIFIELKAPGEKPRELQRVVIRKMRAQSTDVRVIDNKEDCDRLLDFVKSTPGPYRAIPDGWLSGPGLGPV